MNAITKRLTFGIMLALIVWGVALAVGSTGIFIQESMFDLRKSLIVVVCIGLFLGLWAIVLFGRKSDGSHNPDTLTSSQKSSVEIPTGTYPWSRPGLVSLALAVAGAVLWGIAIVSWQSLSMAGTTVLGWLAAVSLLGSATSGVISLSQPVKRRGKWIGLLGLLGFVAAFIAFVARMSP